jgi:hypothetical protein
MHGQTNIKLPEVMNLMFCWPCIILTQFRNKQYQLDTHATFHFIVAHSLDMFRELLAHPQEALHKRRVGDCCVRL